jgi:DNA-binding NarL/FixJ family response regulator
LLIQRTEGGPPLAVWVAPAGPTFLPYSLASIPTALVVFYDPSCRADEASQHLRTLFDLSTAEIAIAEGLIEGKRIREIARQRRVSVETVRSQLRAIFRKTGVARQTDLVRLLWVVLQPRLRV